MALSTSAQNAQTTRWVLITFIVVILFVAVWLIRDIMMLTLSSVILAVLLTTPIRFLVRLGARRPFAVMLTLVLLIAVLGIVMALILPGLIEQLLNLIATINTSINNLTTQLSKPDTYPFIPVYLWKLLNNTNQYAFVNAQIWQTFNLKSIVTQIQDQIPNAISNFFPVVGGLASTVGGVASTILSLLIVLFLATYFVADPNTHVNGIISLVPMRNRGRATEIIGMLDLTLRRYLQGQIILMVFTGITTALELILFGVPLAGALGTIAGLFSFVPTFGPIVALVPILIVTLGSSVSGATGLVVLIFFILQFIQSQVVTPVLMGEEVNLPPAIILLAQIIAGVFFGFLGLLLSVPLAAILVVLVREIYVKDILGDKPQRVEVPAQLDTSSV
jgi:predicted PurR-regulated permease PerM